MSDAVTLPRESEKAGEKLESDEDQRSWQKRLLTFIKPLHVPPLIDKEKDELLWLEEEERAPDFLELFYDLVIVAVLSVFSTAHEVSSPQSIQIYFSYFIIIWWVWASQTLYDVHFQANDWLHRLFKFAQLGAFAFVGATSGDFNPFLVVNAPDEISPDSIIQDSSATSFEGVGIAYAVGRLLLIAQYLLVFIRLRWFVYPLPRGVDPAEHKRRLVLILLPCIASGISAVFWYVAAGITGTSTAKLVLAYFGLGLEIATAVVMPFMPGFIKPPAAMISERFGALTLIILGEGIIGLVRSFSYVIDGFGFTSYAYLQCFCALAIAFTSWYFLFHGWDSKRTLKRRTGTVWLVIHLPLHFVILLVFAGMRNAGTYENINNSVDEAVNAMVNVLNALSNGPNDVDVPDNQWLTFELGKLPLDTSWPQEFWYINESIWDESFPHDPAIALYSYVADVLVSITDSFQIVLSEDVMNEYYNVSNLDDTWYYNDTTTQTKLENDAAALLQQFLQDYYTELAQGVLFFFPAAGGLLLLSALLQLLRIRPLGKFMWTYWVIQVLVALALCFLGFLDVGSNTYFLDTPNNKMYNLLDDTWPLPLVAIIYALLILTESCMLLLARRFDPKHARKVVETPEPTSAKELSESVKETHTPAFERTASQLVPKFEGQSPA